MGALPRRHILIVEDHPQTTQIMARMVRARGYAVLTANSMAEARACAEKDNIGFLISDIGLPDGNGWDLMAELRDRFGIKGAALSGFGMEDDHTRSRQAGFAIHFTKPIQITDLDRILALAKKEVGEPELNA